MNISAAETTAPHATEVSVTEDTLSVELSNGRTLSVPIEWYPRLAHDTLAERQTRITDQNG